MRSKRIIALALVLALFAFINTGFTVVEMDSIENNNEVEDPELYFKLHDSDIEKELYAYVKNTRTKKTEKLVIGKAIITYNESEFQIYIEPDEESGWTVMEIRAFVGNGEIPVAANKKPITALFPFKKKFSQPIQSNLLSIDLFSELGLTWLDEEEELLQNVSIYCQMKNHSNKGVVIADAWVGNADDENFITDLAETGSKFDVELKEPIFRKNVSKEPETETSKAKIEILSTYVPAHRANGDPVELVYRDAAGEITSKRTEAKPLVAVYAEEMAGMEIPPIYASEPPSLSRDVYAAVSVDEGNTWKRVNLSRSADRSSFELENGVEYLGDTHKPNIKVQGNMILVAWTSKYARSGTPRYAISEYIRHSGEEVLDPEGNPIPNPAYEYYEEDIWGVSGPQRSKDYTDDGFAGVEIPFSVVWASRGYVDTTTGEVVWFKAERLTSGRRDAAQITIAAAKNAGFGIVWQEDPDGLRPGEQAGPGEGWSGATTNHKTDIWYSYIGWSDFKKIDTDYVSNGDPQFDEEEGKGDGRPKAEVPMSLPVRLSDNDTLNTDSMKIDPGKLYQDPVLGEGFWRLDQADLPYIDAEGNPVNVYESEGDPDNGNNPLGSHVYGYKLKGLLWDDDQPYLRFYETVNNQDVTKYVAITVDGRLMDGDTGASRGNLMLQPYQKADGSYSAWAVLGYEETKGAGSGPPDTDEEHIPNEYSGEGSDKYDPDLGKNVIYHSYDFIATDFVSGGHILNPQEKASDGTLLNLVDEEGIEILDYLGNPIPAYENARRPRFLIQSKSNAVAGKASTEKGTVMVAVYKMGEEGKGRPSDIIMQRWEVSSSMKGNPYDFKNLAADIQNISSVTPVDTAEFYNDKEELQIKMLSWSQTAGNLDDATSDNDSIYGGYDNDDARAHRGFLRGDFLAIAYVWTPNWTAARNGNDVYNLYIRRSFDGGRTWNTETAISHSEIFRRVDAEGDLERYEEIWDIAAGEFEPARNVSLLRNTKESVIEPRLVGVPGTILTDGVAKYEEDVQDPNSFWVTYGTEINADSNIPKDSEDDEESSGPLDLYYSYSTDQGATYHTETKIINPDSDGNNAGEEVTEWDWLAKDSGKTDYAQAEAQIRMTPDGSIFYAIWNETGYDKDGVYGSDAVFRRIMRDHGFIEVNLIG